MSPACFISLGKMAGLTYVEVLVATMLLVTALLPALEALQPGVAGTAVLEDFTEDHYQLNARLEAVLAQPFNDLDAAAVAAGGPTTPTSYSDVFTYADGRQIVRSVFLSRYDGDNADGDGDPFTGTDGDLIWVRVEIPGTTLDIEALTSAYGTGS
jgi:type II secretory pathway pseudopilin PulG